jgi:L-lysine 2,3-aminomutase
MKLGHHYRKIMPYLPKVLPDRVTKSSSDWQKDMQMAFRRLEPLLDFLDLDPLSAPQKLSVEPNFPILVTQSFAQSMVKRDWQDPLLLQVLPQTREASTTIGYQNDAVGDLSSQVVPGLLHKYASRALLMVSPLCAIHCRYCFRREFPYGEMPRGQAAWSQAWDYIASTPAITEIIFSGGDPLFLDNRRLAELMNRALALPNIETIRFHTRLPVVLPSRIEAELLNIFAAAALKKTLIVVIHSNHPNELSESCRESLKQLRETGALLLNQTVLLKGINDRSQVLVDLSKKLLQSSVLPYYLHQLDRVTGTAHFEVSEVAGLELIADMRKKLPGYAIPKYVREIAGEAQKTPLY